MNHIENGSVRDDQPRNAPEDLLVEMMRSDTETETETDMEDQEILAAAWDGFREQLRIAGDVVLESASSDLERAEGLRFVTRLSSAAIDMILEYGDTRHPEFVRLMTDHRKFYGDNPDTTYDYASISGARRYRISGQRGSSEYLACCIYGWDEQGRTRIVANVADTDMVLDHEGRFELFLSKDPPDDPMQSWVPLSDDVDTVIIRQYFLDRDVEESATFDITCLDEPAAPRPLSPGSVARRLQAAGTFVARGAQLSAGAADGVAQAPNRLTFDSEVVGTPTFYPTPDNQYIGGWYELSPDQALIVEGLPPESRYWSVLLMSRWMESLDTRLYQSSLNKGQISLETDGRFRVVVAARNPGTPNWLDTAGHSSGYVLFRWMQAQNVQRPTLKVVPLDDWAGASSPS